jgi:hypothetical protein
MEDSADLTTLRGIGLVIFLCEARSTGEAVPIRPSARHSARLVGGDRPRETGHSGHRAARQRCAPPSRIGGPSGRADNSDAPGLTIS